MKLHKIVFSREKLEQIPSQERELLLLYGHFANEVNIFVKFLYWTWKNAERGSPIASVVRYADTSQAFSIARVLSGKLYEGWILTTKLFFASKISSEYEFLVPDEARVALQKLKKFFGSENSLKTIRHKAGFHYSPEGMASSYRTLSDNEEVAFFFSDSEANCFYHGPDLISIHALLEAISPGKIEDGGLKLIDDTMSVSNWFRVFVAGYMYAVIGRYIGGSTLAEFGAVELDLSGLSNFDEVEIPYFVEVS